MLCPMQVATGGIPGAEQAAPGVVGLHGRICSEAWPVPR